ncbi:uncharacterized protein LOC134255116, partial [Saccostrea cucullata]|uniref:uncharacterized protein LOC134255116 n=1 Tax=Saccostrea cuccullata TaxID=36930 RepID=UPI002ED22635
SLLQFIHDEPSIQISEDDGKEYSADIDFMEEQDDSPITITLTDFAEIDIYQCCSNEACRQKKMVQNECPVCKRTDSDKKSCRVNFLFSTKDKKDQKIVLFKSTLELILKTELDLNCTKEEITQKIIQLLPIQTKSCISKGNTLYNIQ